MDIDYLMGLLAADGWQRKTVTKNGELHIAMSIELKDRDILEKLSKEIGCKLNIRMRNGTNMYYINIPYSFILEKGQYFSKTRENLYNYYSSCKNKNSFIRGLFDGDGGICKRITRGYEYWSIYFVVNSTQNDIKLILDDWIKKNNFTFSVYKDTRGIICYNYNLSKDSEIKRFYYLLYHEKPYLYLERKYQKFLENGCPKMETF